MADAGHQHEIVFMGMVNVNRDNYLQGTVDIWRCRGCKKLFCDDKRYDEPLKASVGFEEIPEDEEWGILTCTTMKDVYMNSLGVKLGKKVTHACRDGQVHEFVVGAMMAERAGPCLISPPMYHSASCDMPA